MQTEIRSIKMLQLLHYFTPLERVVIGEGRVLFFFLYHFLFRDSTVSACINHTNAL